MKKIGVFIQDLLKSVYGAFILIGIYEIFNLIISLKIGQYVRIDGGVLDDIINTYFALGLIGIGMALLFIKLEKINKDNDIDTVQKCKTLLIKAWEISVAIVILLGNLEDMLIMIPALSTMFGFTLLVLYIIDKKNIKEINRRIKENKTK